MPAAARFEGVWAAAITPRRRASEEMDLSAMWELIDFLSAKKVNGIVLLGSTGEFVHFHLEERIRMISLGVRRSRVPVLVNVSHSALDCAVQLGQAAVRAGAAGLLLMPPYFFRYGERDVLEFYRSFLKQTGTSVPALLYNIPQFTSPIPAAAAQLLIQEGYAGVKDSSPDLDLFPALVRTTNVLVGNDRRFRQARMAGADGAVSGLASAIPELLLAVERSARARDEAAGAILDAHVSEFLTHFSDFPVPVAIREAAAARGLRTGPHATVLDPERTQCLAQFREWFLGWYDGVLQDCARV